MSCYTLTTTTWGELTATTYEDGRRIIVARCKHCHVVTERALSSGDNPLHIQPDHAKTCRFASRPVPPQAITGVTPPEIAGAPISWRVLALTIIICMMIAGLIGFIL